MLAQSAEQWWTALMADKQTLMFRIERYAALTIQKICLPEGFDSAGTDQSHDYQSLGAQGVNNLTNKLMLAMFAPSRPFFRIEAGPDSRAQMAQNGIAEQDVQPLFSKTERGAVNKLDELGQRPKLYTVMRHLIIAGNVQLCLEKDSMRVIALRNFCVKRDSTGRVHSNIIKECVKFDELDPAAQKALGNKYTADTKVDHYKWITWDYENQRYNMTQWVNADQLPTEFSGRWTEEDCPYVVLTWDLADDSDYATGLVEEYLGDLEALSALSEAIVNAAILGTEFRWLVNPSGVTQAEDLAASKNGDALPGKPEDIAPTSGGNAQSLQTAIEVASIYTKRLSLAFMMSSQLTRDAERVTAEEIRQNAIELDTTFGGTYSTLAQTMQGKIARWLLKASDNPITGTDLKIIIITGLDALSRNGDLDNLRAAFQDLAQLSAVPPQLQSRMKYDPLVAFVGDGRGIDLRPYVMTDSEFAQYQQTLLQQQAIAQGQAAHATTTATNAANQQTPPAQ